MNYKNYKTGIVGAKLFVLSIFIADSSGLIPCVGFLLAMRFKVFSVDSILKVMSDKTKNRTRKEKCIYKIYANFINYIVFQGTIKYALNKFVSSYFDYALQKAILIMIKEDIVNDALLHVRKFYYDKIEMSNDRALKVEFSLIVKGLFGALTVLYQGNQYSKIIDLLKIGVINELAFVWKEGRRKNQKIIHRMIVATSNEALHMFLLKDIVSQTINFIDIKLSSICEKFSVFIPEALSNCISIIIPKNITEHLIQISSGMLYIATLHGMKSVYMDKG